MSPEEYQLGRQRVEDKPERDWEHVHVVGGGTVADHLKRFKVEGGWIYRNESRRRHGVESQFSVSICFVPEAAK